MIEPGDRFSVEYGDGKSTEVKSLSIRDKRKLTALVLEIQKNENGINPFEKIEEALALCGVPDDLSEAINEKQGMQIIGSALAGQGLNADDKKKSE